MSNLEQMMEIDRAINFKSTKVSQHYTCTFMNTHTRTMGHFIFR